jgi:HD superfamily phosphohydrolase YqeK
VDRRANVVDFRQRMSDSKIVEVRVRVFVFTVITLGTLAFVWALGSSWSHVEAGNSVVGILTFILVGLGLELGRHRLATGSAGGSIAFVAFLGAALVFGPVWGSVVTAASLVCSQLTARRPPIRIAFNVGQYVLAIVLSTWAYISLGGTIPPSSLNEAAGPFIGLVLVFFFTNSGAVSAVISISEERPFTEVWIRNTWTLAGYDMVAGTLGLAIAWLYLRFGVVGVVAVVIPILFMRHTYAVNIKLQETQRELLELMVKAIEARDPYTSGHSQRVSELARALARSLRLSFKDIESIGTAALLHDVGKIFEEFAPILRKEGKLTRDEQALMQTHPSRSAELVGTISSLHGQVYRCVRHHHENFDGSGYPDGLTGDQIPTGARIIMVADTIDAMTTDRPYRKALPFDRVLQELEKYSGRQFDPAVVTALHKSAEVKRLIERPGLPTEAPRVPDRGRVVQLVAR